MQGAHATYVGADGADLGQGHDLKTGYGEGIVKTATVPILKKCDVQGYVCGCDALILRPAREYTLEVPQVVDRGRSAISHE